MPKETFYNLADEKRQIVEQAAIEEFSEYSFDGASINRIVTRAEIAKGSFYQYFEGKEDLYRYVMEMIVQRKLAYMSDLLQNPEAMDFFSLLRALYRSGLMFAVENPKLLEIGNKLLADTNHPMYVEVVGDNAQKSRDVFEPLLEKAKERGELRENIQVELVSFFLTTINLALPEYYLRKTGGKTAFSSDLMEFVEEFIQMIQFGICKEER